MAVSAGYVYDLVSDITRMGEWSPECRGGEWLDTPGRVGSRFLGHNEAGGLEWTTECEVLVADRPHEFAWDVLTLAPAPGTSVWRFTMTPHRDGTSVTETFQMTAPPHGLQRALDAGPPERRAGLLESRRSVIAAGIAVTLEAIKRAAEEEGERGHPG